VTAVDSSSARLDDLAAPDLAAASSVIDLATRVVDTAVRHLHSTGGPDRNQTLAYDLAHSAAQVETARSLLDYGAKGEIEARITCAFTADMVHDLVGRLTGREMMWGVEAAPLREAHSFLEKFRAPQFVAALAEQPGPRHLDPDFELVQDTFRSFADNEITPRAEHVHRENLDVPRSSSAGSPRWARSASASPRSTAATARAATASTWAWSSRRRS
jgi:(2S)-methylsuccinyl-CoA dehydrogenase